MRKIFFCLFAVSALVSCGSKDQSNSSGSSGKIPADAAHTISKDGIGDIKIGMSQEELEKTLNQKLAMRHANDTGEVWSDTATVKYKDMDLSLYFQMTYHETARTEMMQLSGVETGSPLCKTPTGLGVGDNRAAILAAYEDNPIDMGPENEMVNDTTWVLSKTKYIIYVKDDKWDKELIFRLVNKKVASIEASLLLGD